MPRFVRGLVVAIALLVGLPAGAARADVELPIVATPSPRVRVDGWLVEWPTNQLAAVGGDARGRLRIAFAPGEGGLYVAVSVDDDRLVRTDRATPAEDAVVVTIAVPRDGTNVDATEIWLYAGIPNETAASLTVAVNGGRPSSPRDGDIVEMPTNTGYDLEAFVPWSAIAGGREYARYRVMARLHDVDQAGGTARDTDSVSRIPANLATLPRVIGTAGELRGLTAFLRERRSRATDIEYEIRANFTGDSDSERAFVLNGELVLVGADYLGGSDFSYARLGAPRCGLTDLRAVDVDGDGKNELFLVARRTEGDVEVTEARLFSFPGDRIQPIFRAEIGLGTPAGAFVSQWSFETTANRRPALRIRTATTTSAATRPPAHVPQHDAVGLLVASSGLASRLYAFDSGRFGVIAEEQAAVTNTPTPTPSARGSASTSSTTRPATTTPATTPPSTSATSSSSRPAFDPSSLYGVVRRERSLPDSTRPRFSTNADVVEDARPEVLCILGKSLVLVGPGYRNGLGYFALDLSVASDEDVRGLRAQDVTGDGKAEIWITLRQPIGGGANWLELLVLYRIDGQSLQPIFTAQLAFGDATREVRNEARVVGSGRSLQLALAPGRAQGFDARSFPFASTATPGMTTLLLPWRDRETRYRWNGSAIVGP